MNFLIQNNLRKANSSELLTLPEHLSSSPILLGFVLLSL